MKDGLLCSVFSFPTKWPPREAIKVAEKIWPSGGIVLMLNTNGEFVASVTNDNDLRTVVFQPMAIEGSGGSLISLLWSPSEIALTVNSIPVKHKAQSGDILKIVTKPVQLPETISSIAINPAHCTPAENFFLSTLRDLALKLRAGGQYNLIRAAGLLRGVLLDGTPLVHIVNRSYGLKLQFVRSDYTCLLPGPSPEVDFQNVDASRFPGAKTVSLSLDAFLASPCVTYQKQTASVLDVIRACANSKGGIHFENAVAKSAILQWDDLFKFCGLEPSVAAIAGICRVSLNGLVPLVQRIAETRQGIISTRPIQAN